MRRGPKGSWDWQERAACRGADIAIFFGGNGRSALEICRSCRVQDDCLRFALSLPADQDFGVWGGASETERRSMRRALTGATRGGRR